MQRQVPGALILSKGEAAIETIVACVVAEHSRAAVLIARNANEVACVVAELSGATVRDDASDLECHAAYQSAFPK